MDKYLSAFFKPVLALIISILIFAGISLLAGRQLSNFIQTNFFNPSASGSMKIIFNLSMFLTIYLAVFFLINFRSNPVTVVQNRLKQFKENLFEQLYVNRDSQDRVKLIFELEQRRDGIRSELKNNLKLTRHSEETIDGIIDRSWDRLLAVIKTGSSAFTGIEVTGKPEENNKETSEAEETAETEHIENINEIESLEQIDEPEILEELNAVEDFSENINIEKSEVTPGKHMGLLRLAMKINEEKAKFSEIEITVAKSPPEKLPLTEIPPENKTVSDAHRGYFALASEIEFNSEYPVPSEPEEEEQVDAELEIVSPVTSMFSALHDKEPSADKKKPAVKKQKTAAKEKKPAAKKQKTAAKKKKPAVKKQKTAVKEKKPAAKKKKAVTKEIKPAAEKKKSIPKERKPDSEKKDESKKRKSASGKTKPVIEEKKPVRKSKKIDQKSSLSH